MKKNILDSFAKSLTLTFDNAEIFVLPFIIQYIIIAVITPTTVAICAIVAMFGGFSGFENIIRDAIIGGGNSVFTIFCFIFPIVIFALIFNILLLIPQIILISREYFLKTNSPRNFNMARARTAVMKQIGKYLSIYIINIIMHAGIIVLLFPIIKNINSQLGVVSVLNTMLVVVTASVTLTSPFALVMEIATLRRELSLFMCYIESAKMVFTNFFEIFLFLLLFNILPLIFNFIPILGPLIFVLYICFRVQVLHLTLTHKYLLIKKEVN